VSNKVILDTRVLDRIIKQFPSESADIVAMTALQIEAKAKQNAPVDTGALRNSISSQEIDRYTWHVGDGVEYGFFVELGTSRMSAQPFLIPALMSVERWFLAQWHKLFEAL
jgi:HK97 gp10 family phage protein